MLTLFDNRYVNYVKWCEEKGTERERRGNAKVTVWAEQVGKKFNRRFMIWEVLEEFVASCGEVE